MTCRRCITTFKRTDAVRISTHADQLYDKTPRGATVHADRVVCAANLKPYRKEERHDKKTTALAGKNRTR